MKDILLAQLGSIIRHALAALGGFLVAHGVFAPEDAQHVADGLEGPLCQIISGVGLYLASHTSAWFRNLDVLQLRRALMDWASSPTQRATALASGDVIQQAMRVVKMGLVVLGSVLTLGLSSCKSTAKVTPPDEFDSIIAKMMRTMIALMALCLVSCAPGFTATFYADGQPKSMAQTTGFLHQADKLAVKTKLPNGMEYTVVMVKPDGTRVANNAILAAGTAYAVAANAGVAKAKEQTLQVKDTNATSVANNKIAADAATAQSADKLKAQTSLLQANPQAVKPEATTLGAP